MPKYKSRATRCGEACEALSELAGKLHEAIDEVASIPDGPGSAKKVRPLLKAAAELLPPSADEISSLAEEMESWRDNIEEKFSQTQKYEDVSTAADTLREQADTLEGIECPDVSEDDFDCEEVSTALNDAADEIESAVSELESVEFPGMFG